MDFVIIVILIIAVVVIIVIFSETSKSKSGESVAIKDANVTRLIFQETPNVVFKSVVQAIQSIPQINIDDIIPETFQISGNTDPDVTLTKSTWGVGILVKIIPQQDNSCVCEVHVKAKMGFGPIIENEVKKVRSNLVSAIKINVAFVEQLDKPT